MIVVEPMPVHPTAVLTRGNFRHADDAVIPGFRRITEACKAEGVVMIHQLYHVGQHGDVDNSFCPNWSPSGRPSFHDSDGSHAMSEAEIEAVIEGFVQAAGRAREAGFDGVELFAAYHALIDQFWAPWSNRRDDRWGGSFANRMRFSTAIIEGLRRRAGDDFIIGLAVSLHPAVEVSHSVEAMQEIAAWHDERGLIDYVAWGTGSYFDFYPLMPTVLRRTQ
jgi:2,4-dienoyl-CoA reductase-like NADH-dependent reductase (Old Yellow Enzyme family)